MIVQASKLDFSIDGKKLLSGVSFSAQPGEVLAVLGSNGAGKSTLLRLLSRDLKPDKGEITLNRVALSVWPNQELARCRAMLTQQTTVSFPFTTAEMVMMGRYPHFRLKPSPLDKNVIRHVMQFTGIVHLQDRNYLSLSGGEQQRVQLARVLAQLWDHSFQQKLLLLDEPVSALDIEYQHQVMQLIRKLATLGATVIVVVHDLNLAYRYADKFLLLKRGHLLAHGDRSVLTTSGIREAFNVVARIEKAGTAHGFVAVE